LAFVPLTPDRGCEPRVDGAGGGVWTMTGGEGEITTAGGGGVTAAGGGAAGG
jgi:hypothetical protein